MANKPFRRFSYPHHWPLAQRLAHHSSKCPTTGCILWTGKRDKDGYGTLSWQKQPRRAHRMAWEIAHGPIPAGLFVCHTCDVPSCVNPDHLFLGTPADNMRDRDRKGRLATRPGVKMWNAKLTDSDIQAMRRSPEPQAKIAAAFGINQGQVSKIRRRLAWAHVP